MQPQVLAGGIGDRRPGHDTGWRQLPWTLLVAVADGPYRIQAEAGRSVDLAAGEATVLPPGCRHRIRQCFPGTVTRIAWLHLRCPLGEGDDLFERQAFPPRLREPGLHAAIAGARAGTDDLAGRLAGLAAACAILRLLLPHGTARTADPGRARLAPVLAWAREHLAEPLTRALLARRAGLSELRFHVVFQAALNEAPMAWLRRQRISLAQDLLLHSALPVGAVAARCGFPDPFHFTRVFRAACGASPRAWRRDQGA
jgi:AraC-like DNA-binding protein